MILGLLKTGAIVLYTETIDISSDCLLERLVLAERGEVLTLALDLAVVLIGPLYSPLLFWNHNRNDAILKPLVDEIISFSVS